MTITTSARRGTAIVASLGAAALLTLATASTSSAAHVRDSDHDGMPNHWEIRHHLNPHRANAKGDADKDGLRNLAEFRHGTNPRSSDTDEDGVEDDSEVHDGCMSTDPTDADTDNDGIEDGQEDTDEDGIDNAEDETEDECADDAELEPGNDKAPVAFFVVR
jgi:Bacterial TSP3 repeat